MRQPLLPFATLLSKERKGVAAKQLGRPGPALILPAEVWHQILKELYTITLKTFRLVCRSWNSVGTVALFQTVYLDSYEASWVRFEHFTASKYAQLATKIVWTPLVLYKSCCDGESWRSQYPNLFRRLSHSKTCASMLCIVRLTLTRETKICHVSRASISATVTNSPSQTTRTLKRNVSMSNSESAYKGPDAPEEVRYLGKASSVVGEKPTQG